MIEQKKPTNAQEDKKFSVVAPVMSDEELASLGDGTIAYIRRLSSEEAGRLYPELDELPGGIEMFALHGADGTPIALTDSHQAAIGQALEDQLEVSGVH